MFKTFLFSPDQCSPPILGDHRRSPIAFTQRSYGAIPATMGDYQRFLKRQKTLTRPFNSRSISIVSRRQLTLFVSFPGSPRTRLGLWSILSKNTLTKKKKLKGSSRLDPYLLYGVMCFVHDRRDVSGIVSVRLERYGCYLTRHMRSDQMVFYDLDFQTVNITHKMVPVSYTIWKAGMVRP